jgi:hypothetical protein
MLGFYVMVLGFYVPIGRRSLVPLSAEAVDIELVAESSVHEE